MYCEPFLFQVLSDTFAEFGPRSEVLTSSGSTSLCWEGTAVFYGKGE